MKAPFWRAERSWAHSQFDELRRVVAHKHVARIQIFFTDETVEGGFNRSSQRTKNSSSDKCIQRFSGRFPIQRFSWSLIQGQSHGLQGFGAVHAQIRSLWKILA